MPRLLGVAGATAGCRDIGTLAGLDLAPPLQLEFWSRIEGCGMRCVAVKFRDITQKSDCEGSIPAPN